MSKEYVALTTIHYISDGKAHDNPGYDSSEKSSSNDAHINVNDKNDLRQRPSIANGSGEGDVNHLEKLDTAFASKDVDGDLNLCAKAINRIQKTVIEFYCEHKTAIIRGIRVILLALYIAYVIFSLCFVYFGDEGSYRLLICTIIGLLILGWSLTGDNITKFIKSSLPNTSSEGRKRTQTIIRWVLYVVSLVAIVTLLIVMVALDTPENLISLAGLAAFVFLTWITSVSPAKVNWHPVFWGFSIQFYFAVIILRTRWGYEAFKWLGDRISEFLSYSAEGAIFVFGTQYQIHFFTMAIMPTIIFMSSIISMLYYLGVMQAIVSVLGSFLSFCMGTTPGESFNAAANIFCGMTDSPLMIRPFIAKMTKSELHAVMTGGFATIAGSVLGAYIGFGVPANHLLSASVMSAPAALAISKLTYPEIEVPQVSNDEYGKIERSSERNLIEAASAGASVGCKIVAAVLCNVIAFLSILKFVNVTLTWFGTRAGLEELTFEFICSYLLYPVALFMGTELGPDCRRIGELVGIKTFTNEFIAYSSLRTLLENKKLWLNYSSRYDVNDPLNVQYDDLDIRLARDNITLEKGFLSKRSEVIATYALCGFSNFGSMGITIGALNTMAPNRKHDLASIVFRAMLAGNVACFVTACVAGLFYEEFE